MLIIKASGEKEEFDPEKIRRTCLRAGANKELTEKVIKEVELNLFEGITTKSILKIIVKLLEKKHSYIASRYDLKGAILRLGPAGFIFEQFFSSLLREYGYQTKVHTMIQGQCLEHEIDIIAEKTRDEFYRGMIECKYHNAPGIFTSSKDILYSYSRFLDLKEGFKNGKCMDFNQLWVVSNTKFSFDSVTYAKCKNIKLVGWNFPKAKGIEYMLESKNLYPITVLRKINREILNRLVSANIMFCKDLIEKDIGELKRKTGLTEGRLNILIGEAKGVLR